MILQNQLSGPLLHGHKGSDIIHSSTTHICNLQLGGFAFIGEGIPIGLGAAFQIKYKKVSTSYVVLEVLLLAVIHLRVNLPSKALAALAMFGAGSYRTYRKYLPAMTTRPTCYCHALRPKQAKSKSSTYPVPSGCCKAQVHKTSRLQSQVFRHWGRFRYAEVPPLIPHLVYTWIIAMYKPVQLCRTH